MNDDKWLSWMTLIEVVLTVVFLSAFFVMANALYIIMNN